MYYFILARSGVPQLDQQNHGSLDKASLWNDRALFSPAFRMKLIMSYLHLSGFYRPGARE
jgi:hypothetical protein